MSIAVLLLIGSSHQGMAQCRGEAKGKSSPAKKSSAKKSSAPRSSDYRMVVNTLDNPNTDGTTIISYDLEESSLTIELNRKAGTLTTTTRNLNSTMSGEKFTIDKRKERKVEKADVGEYQPMVFKTTDGGDIQLTIKKR